MSTPRKPRAKKPASGAVSKGKSLSSDTNASKTFPRNLKKHSRMELKTTEPVKKMIMRAAKLKGVDMQAFVISSAEKSARKIIEHYDSLALSVDDQERFLDVLSKPPKAGKKLKALMTLESLNER